LLLLLTLNFTILNVHQVQFLYFIVQDRLGFPTPSSVASPGGNGSVATFVDVPPSGMTVSPDVFLCLELLWTEVGDVGREMSENN